MNSPSHPAVYPWQPACWMRLTGADSAAFLQGQFTNDLRGAVSAGAVYGLWLNVKGKVIADSFVIAAADGAFWIGSYFSPAAVIRERLESHIIADDVTIEDQTGDWHGVTVFGTDAAAHLPTGQLGFVFSGRRTRAPHVEWVSPKASGKTASAVTATKKTLTDTEVLRLRIEAAIPAVPTDIGDTDLPNEGGLDHDAISYTKGCYLGQEVMARLKSMGQVRRRLLRVVGRVPVPVTPAPVFVGARQVGELRSAVATADGLMGLAMLSLLHVPPGTSLSLSAAGEPTLQLLDHP